MCVHEQVRAPDEAFPDESADLVQIRVSALADQSVTSIEEDDSAVNFFLPLVEVSLSKATTVAELKARFAEVVGIEPALQRLVSVNFSTGVAGILPHDDAAYAVESLDLQTVARVFAAWEVLPSCVRS